MSANHLSCKLLKLDIQLELVFPFGACMNTSLTQGINQIHSYLLAVWICCIGSTLGNQLVSVQP